MSEVGFEFMLFGVQDMDEITTPDSLHFSTSLVNLPPNLLNDKNPENLLIVTLMIDI